MLKKKKKKKEKEKERKFTKGLSHETQVQSLQLARKILHCSNYGGPRVCPCDDCVVLMTLAAWTHRYASVPLGEEWRISWSVNKMADDAGHLQFDQPMDVRSRSHMMLMIIIILRNEVLLNLIE